MPNSQPGPDEATRLWTPADLAAFLGYKEATIRAMVSQRPHLLPPRVQGLSRPRWVREVCLEWVRARSVAPVSQHD